MNKFFLHHPSSSSSSSSSSRRALHATQHDWCSDRARIIIIVVAHAPIDSDIELLLGHHERCVSTTNNPSNASDGRDERRDRSVTGVWCARRGMPRARARTATPRGRRARPTVGVAKRHIARRRITLMVRNHPSMRTSRPPSAISRRPKVRHPGRQKSKGHG